MIHTTKNGVMKIYKFIKWVYSDIESLKSKQEDSSKKVDILEVVRMGNLSSLLEYLKELTKSIGDVKAIS